MKSSQQRTRHTHTRQIASCARCKGSPGGRFSAAIQFPDPLRPIWGCLPCAAETAANAYALSRSGALPWLLNNRRWQHQCALPFAVLYHFAGLQTTPGNPDMHVTCMHSPVNHAESNIQDVTPLHPISLARCPARPCSTTHARLLSSKMPHMQLLSKAAGRQQHSTGHEQNRHTRHTTHLKHSPTHTHSAAAVKPVL